MRLTDSGFVRLDKMKPQTTVNEIDAMVRNKIVGHYDDEGKILFKPASTLIPKVGRYVRNNIIM